MMMSASSKLATPSFDLPSYTHHFQARLFHRLLPRGFAAAVDRFTFCRGERLDPSPVLLKDHIIKDVCTIRTSASSPAPTRTSSALSRWSSVCTSPVKCFNLSLRGVRICSIGARRGEDLQSVHFDRPRDAHIACKSSRAYANEEFVGLEGRGSSTSCESNEKDRAAQQTDETSTIICEGVVYTQTGERNESDTKVASQKRVGGFKRFKINPEGTEVRLKLDLCSKLADLHGALETFEKVKQEQRVQLDIYNYNILLYLCSGAASGSLLRDCRRKKKTSEAHAIQDDVNASRSSNSLRELVHFSPEDIELAVRKGADIFEDMLLQGLEPNEATYTSIIRLAVAKNDGDLAFETIKLMESSGIPPKLRSYGPLMVCFCESNKADKAYEVDNHMINLDVQPDESMLDSLLKVSIEAGREDKVYSLLHRLRRSVRDLLPTTMKSIEKWFTSKGATFAGKESWKSLPSKKDLREATLAHGGGFHGLGWLGMGPWQVSRTSINKTGLCLCCGERLCAVDLDTLETEDFADSIAKMACEGQQQPQDFKSFQDWVDRHGPFDAIVDGANVGFYNPKAYKGFNVSLLNAVLNAATSRFCTHKPPLVVIHNRHKRQITQSSDSSTMLSKWRKHNSLYFTPMGSNDDWFWLYAAVKCKCVLISNDQMRDHIFALLGNNFFPKWKERHQVGFTFAGMSLDLHMPPPYSTIIQESEGGSWHIPQARSDESEASQEWLCVTRPGATSY